MNFVANKLKIPNFIAASLSLPRKNAKRAKIEEFFPHLTQEQYAIDIGCGHGALIYGFSKIGNWTFVDPDRQNLLVAKSFLKGSFVSEDFLNFSNGHSKVDLITSFDSIMYFSDTEQLLKKMVSLLANRGKVLIAGTYYGNSPGRILRKVLFPANPSGFKSEESSERICELLTNSGVVIRNTDYFSGPVVQVYQAVLDFMVRFSVQRSNSKESADSFTQEIKVDLPDWKAKIFKIIRISALVADRLDRFFFPHIIFKFAYDGYIIFGEKVEKNTNPNPVR